MSSKSVTKPKSESSKVKDAIIKSAIRSVSAFGFFLPENLQYHVLDRVLELENKQRANDFLKSLEHKFYRPKEETPEATPTDSHALKFK
jgi:hypothetical protein